MNKEQQTKTGFFVAFKDEAEQIQAEKVVNTGRNGVFYDPERLKNCIQEKQIKDAYMVEIEVHPKFVINCNGKKFGIKQGKNIPAKAVTKIS